MANKQTLKELEELVIQEAINIKKYAIPSELKKLDFHQLDENHVEKCIYGQMTGNCENPRANQLIDLCALKVYIPEIKAISNLTNYRLNGAPKDVKYSRTIRHKRLLHLISPIERMLFLYLDKSKPKTKKVQKLVAFLKGDTDVLVF